MCPLCRLLEGRAGAPAEPLLTPLSCAVLRSPPVSAVLGGIAQCPLSDGSLGEGAGHGALLPGRVQLQS